MYSQYTTCRQGSTPPLCRPRAHGRRSRTQSQNGANPRRVHADRRPDARRAGARTDAAHHRDRAADRGRGAAAPVPRGALLPRPAGGRGDGAAGAGRVGAGGAQRGAGRPPEDGRATVAAACRWRRRAVGLGREALRRRRAAAHGVGGHHLDRVPGGGGPREQGGRAGALDGRGGQGPREVCPFRHAADAVPGRRVRRRRVLQPAPRRPAVFHRPPQVVGAHARAAAGAEQARPQPDDTVHALLPKPTRRHEAPQVHPPRLRGRRRRDHRALQGRRRCARPPRARRGVRRPGQREAGGREADPVHGSRRRRPGRAERPAFLRGRGRGDDHAAAAAAAASGPPASKRVLARGRSRGGRAGWVQARARLVQHRLAGCRGGDCRCDAGRGRCRALDQCDCSEQEVIKVDTPRHTMYVHVVAKIAQC